MELRHLRYFIRAAELLHFTKAAESLYISQPSLSGQIQQLEEELGNQLFARVGRHVRLTEAGQTFLVHARQALKALEAGEQEVNELQGLLRGKLRIAAIPTFSTIFLPAVSSFQSSHPNVYIEITSQTSNFIEKGILEGNIDLGFTLLPVENEEIKACRLFKDELVLVVSKQHSLAKRKTISLKDLNALPMVLATQAIVNRTGNKYLRDNNVQPKIMVECDETSTVLALVKTADLATMMPRTLVSEDLITIPFKESGPAICIGAIWNYLSAAAKEFLQLVQKD